MKINHSEKYQESIYAHTLENGLKIALFHRPNFSKSFFLLGTPFGGLNTTNRDIDNNLVEYPAGLAHFLEHKMFEAKEGDVMDEFSRLGANVNAFTSYNETVYHFSTTEDYREPLALLMDFTANLHISEASVEKEKGIIISELEMYNQQSDARLIHTTLSNLFHDHPLAHDIGGTIESVSNTTLSNLEDCFKDAYSSENMLLVGVTSAKPEEVIAFIDEQAKLVYSTKPKHPSKRELYPYSAFETSQYHEIKMDVQKEKSQIAFRLAGDSNSHQRHLAEWALRVGLDAQISTLNPDFQTWIDTKLINDYYNHDIELGVDYGMVVFTSESTSSKDFEAFVKAQIKYLQENLISDDILSQLKKRYFGQGISAMNSFENTAIYYLRVTFDDLDFYNSLECVNNISAQEIQNIFKEIDLNNSVITTLKPLN